MKSEVSSLQPWNCVSLTERRELISQAKTAKRKLAVYYNKQPESSTFRYRCYNTLRASERSPLWQAVFFCEKELPFAEEFIEAADIFILGRHTRWENNVRNVIRLARKHHKQVILDIDDYVFNLSALSTVTNTIGDLNALDYWRPYMSDTYRTANACDAFLTTNAFLGEKLQSQFQRPYEILRNTFNAEQLSASNVYVQRKNQKTPHKEFVIGYFGGSPTHMNDLNVVLPELLAFLKQHSNARFDIVGYIDIFDAAKPYLSSGQIRFLPFTDFRKLQRLMSEVDVNIAPLVINDFTNSKSELKFFEAAIVNTTTIASPTYAFSHSIKDKKTGFLCQQGQWFDCLELLYQNPALNRDVALRAQSYCYKEYFNLGDIFLRELETVYTNLLMI